LITGLIRRIRFSAGSLALLGLLAFVATVLMTAAPRLANGYADTGLRERIGAAAYQVRDLTYRQAPDPASVELRPVEVEASVGSFERSMGPALRSALSARWTSLQVGPQGLAALGPGDRPLRDFPLHLGLRTQSGVVASAVLVEGSWPQRYLIAGEPIEAAMSEGVAKGLGLAVNTTYTTVNREGIRFEVRIVGIFRPVDAQAPIWEPEPEVVTPFIPVGEDGVPWRGVLLTDVTGIAAVMNKGIGAQYEWRFRVDETRITTSNMDEIAADVIAARNLTVTGGASSQTGLDGMIDRFGDALRGVSAILAVVQAGVLATVFGLALLAARALVERRRTEVALLRARGGSLLAMGSRLAIEVGLVVPVAVVVAWLVGRTLPGRPGSADWLAILLAVAAVLAVPVIAGVAQRKVSFVGDAEMVRPRRSVRRITGELLVLVLAGLGALLLHRRGLAPANGVDIYLVSVPVLLGTGVALIALRVLPWPLRFFGRLTSRARGAVAFLGFARAGRASTASAGPLVVLVVAVSTGIFSAVVATTIDHGRDRATDQAVPGDAIVEGFFFSPATTVRMAGLDGVTGVASFSRNPASVLVTSLAPDARSLIQVYSVTADGPALADVMAASGVTGELPAEFVQATVTSGAVPAVVSPQVAADVGDGGAVDVQGKIYAFRVSTVAASFPGVPLGVSRFVVLPQQALDQPESKPVLPTAFVVAGDVDLQALRETGDDGQREWEESVSGIETLEVDSPTTAATWAQRRAELEGAGVNQLLAFAFVIGAAGGSALALLAVGFAVVAGARARGRTLSRLRTMGLSRRQGSRLLAYELLPVLTIGALAGVAVGVALPILLAPVLELTAFTGGIETRPQLDPVVAAAVGALVAVGMLAALVLEQVVNRRLRLGDVLRLGEEMV
jgi:putative ABC transport system permease protein